MPRLQENGYCDYNENACSLVAIDCAADDVTSDVRAYKNCKTQDFCKNFVSMMESSPADMCMNSTTGGAYFNPVAHINKTLLGSSIVIGPSQLPRLTIAELPLRIDR